jgi:MSHA biogenesis protein MshG
VGEANGKIGLALDALADLMERQDRLLRQLRLSLTHPLMLFGISWLMVFVLSHLLVPHFARIFNDMHATMPLITRLLFGAVSLTESPLFVLPALLIGGLAFHRGRLWLTTHAGRLAWDSRKISIPVVGSAFRKAAVARWAQSMAALLRAGVHMDVALMLAGAASGNEALGAHMEVACAALWRGEPLYRALHQPDIFDKLVVQMVRVGEDTGSLDRMFYRLAQYYEQDLDTMLASLGSVLEPIFITFTGVAVGVIVLAIFLPFYSLIGRFAN